MTGSTRSVSEHCEVMVSLEKHPWKGTGDPTTYHPRIAMTEQSRYHNSVKGALANNRRPSLGRDHHVRLVVPDRQSDTVAMRNPLNIATWNVRTLHQPGKLTNLEIEAHRMKVNILGVAEVRWKGNGKILTESGMTFIYSGGSEHARGVGLMLDKHTSKHLMGYWAVSDRVLMIKLKGNPFKFQHGCCSGICTYIGWH